MQNVDCVIWAAYDKTIKMKCALSADSDQPGRMPSLIRVFVVHMKKAWVLSYPLGAQRRLWSDWADAQADLSHRWAHSHCVGFVVRRLIFCQNELCCPCMPPLSQTTTKAAKWHVHPGKTQFSLGICPDWSVSSMYALWVAKGPTFPQADSEDSDQTRGMSRLILVFTGRTGHFVGFVMLRLTCLPFMLYSSCMTLNWKNNILANTQFLLTEVF